MTWPAWPADHACRLVSFDYFRGSTASPAIHLNGPHDSVASLVEGRVDRRWKALKPQEHVVSLDDYSFVADEFYGRRQIGTTG